MKKLFFIVSFIIFVSCSKSKNTDAVYVNLGAEPKTIDPALNITLQGSTYVTHLFECLTTKYKDIAIQPGAAESWDISEDGLTYIFHLRTNGKWSDGKTLTANDFEYSWKRVVNPDTASEPSYLFEPILNFSNVNAGKMDVEEFGVKALDDFTLEVKLEYPTAYFLELVNLPVFSPVREDIVEKNPDDWTINPETCIGNGAFKLLERKPDESITVVKNTNYWNKDTIVAEKIKFVLMDNPNSAVAGVKEGILHFSDTFPWQDIDSLREEGLIDIATRIGTVYYALNTTNKTLKDKRVRKALSLAIDRNYIIENIVKSGKPAGALVPRGVTDIKGDFRENAGEYISVEPKDYTNNVEEAKRLMAEAGYPNGENYPVIEVLVSSEGNVVMVEAIQQMWKNIGVDAIIMPREWAVILQSFRDLSYQMVLSGWTGDYNDPMTMLDLYLSYAPSNPGYSNFVYDNLLEEAQKTVNAKDRMQILHKAEEILMNDMPIIPLHYRSNPLMISKRLMDYKLDPLSKYRFHYSYLTK